MRRTLEIGARAVTLIIRRRETGVLAYGKDVANRGGGLDNVTHGSLLRVARFGENERNQLGTEFIPFHKRTGTGNSRIRPGKSKTILPCRTVTTKSPTSIRRFIGRIGSREIQAVIARG